MASDTFTFDATCVLPKDEDIPIWRYMSFAKFVDLLNSSSLYFSRTNKFIDQFEGYVNTYTSSLIDKMFNEFPNSQEMREEYKGLLNHLKDWTFISCWHMNYNESVEMWKRYAPIEGVAIKSNAKRLIVSLYHQKIGPMYFKPITYTDFVNQEIDHTAAMDLINCKMPEYSFEQEYRALLMYAEGVPAEGKDGDTTIINMPEYGFKIKVSFDALVDSIIVSPDSQPWFYELVTNLTNQVTDSNNLPRKAILKSSLENL